MSTVTRTGSENEDCMMASKVEGDRMTWAVEERWKIKEMVVADISVSYDGLFKGIMPAQIPADPEYLNEKL